MSEFPIELGPNDARTWRELALMALTQLHTIAVETKDQRHIDAARDLSSNAIAIRQFEGTDPNTGARGNVVPLFGMRDPNVARHLGGGAA